MKVNLARNQWSALLVGISFARDSCEVEIKKDHETRRHFACLEKDLEEIAEIIMDELDSHPQYTTELKTNFKKGEES